MRAIHAAIERRDPADARRAAIEHVRQAEAAARSIYDAES
jgi:DNA-binding FadR family transcriptional regulator